MSHRFVAAVCLIAALPMLEVYGNANFTGTVTGGSIQERPRVP